MSRVSHAHAYAQAHTPRKSLSAREPSRLGPMGLALAGACTFAAAGCAPQTQYRYTALSPAAQPVAWDGRNDRVGTVRLEGSLTQSSVIENYAPQVGDTAMLVPQFVAQGTAMIAVSRVVELGVRGSYAAYNWTQPSAVGTMPVPGAPSSWGIGPEVRLAFPFGEKKHFALGLVANIIDTQVPYAGWQLTGPGSNSMPTACTPSSSCVNSYSLGTSGTESDLVYSFGIVPSYAFGDEGQYGHVFGGITATTGFQNQGFTNTQQSGSSVSTFWPFWIFSAGYAGSIDMLRLSAMIYKPVTDESSPVNYGLGFIFTVGLAIPAWDPRHTDYSEPPPPPSEPPPPPSEPASPSSEPASSRSEPVSPSSEAVSSRSEALSSRSEAVR